MTTKPTTARRAAARTVRPARSRPRDAEGAAPPTPPELPNEALRVDALPAPAADGSLDDALPAALSAVRLELVWPGKAAAMAEAQAPVAGRLVPRPRDGVQPRRAVDRVIQGENLAVLRALEGELAGQVKLIYLDPPYNTGQDFVYRDRFRGEGARTNAKRHVRPRHLQHAEWLSMIYPRLAVARRLLAPDGVLFISIDDHEVAHLRIVLDEIFGENQHVATLVWQGGRKNDSYLVSVSHEYVVCVCRNRLELARQKVKWWEPKDGVDHIYAEYDRLRKQHADDHAAVTRGLKAWYRRLPKDDPARAHVHYSHCDARGIYFADNLSWPGGGGPRYEVRHPITGRPCTIPSRGWVFATAETMQDMIADDRIAFGPDERKVPTRKRYLHETDRQAPASVFYQDGRTASQRLKRLFGEKVFDHPKDERVLARLVRMTTGGSDLVLDFFAGSGATGHAVWLANAEDGAARRFILVQQDEPSGLAAWPNIAEITRERLRRVQAQWGSADTGRGPRPAGFQAWQWVAES